jgi:hypothetical protein
VCLYVWCLDKQKAEEEKVEDERYSWPVHRPLLNKKRRENNNEIDRAFSLSLLTIIMSMLKVNSWKSLEYNHVLFVIVIITNRQPRRKKMIDAFSLLNEDNNSTMTSKSSNRLDLSVYTNDMFMCLVRSLFSLVTIARRVKTFGSRFLHMFSNRILTNMSRARLSDCLYLCVL